jgi:hypothetical protein
MEIRREAPLETPHILLLIDDEEDTLLPALGERARRGRPLYRTPLAPEAGSVSGWLLDQEADWDLLAGGLENLARRAGDRYGARREGEAPFLYAAGDGNHSLATAKAIWEEYKKSRPDDPDLMNHPARWALVEVENLYDPGISFEPIHRLVFGAAPEAMLGLLSALPGFSRRPVGDPAELIRLTEDPAAPGNRLGLIAGDSLFLVESEAPGIATGPLQPLLDGWLRDQGGPAAGQAAIDYIHGTEELFRLAGARGSPVPAVGFLLPPVKKSGLFQTVARLGPLPRKSFSMGEAIEKRFYLECRGL